LNAYIHIRRNTTEETFLDGPIIVHKRSVDAHALGNVRGPAIKLSVFEARTEELPSLLIGPWIPERNMPPSFAVNMLD
jgi:hypothetical protein